MDGQKVNLLTTVSVEDVALIIPLLGYIIEGQLLVTLSNW